MTGQADAQWFDDMYNNRARVPEHARHLADWARRSTQVRVGQVGELDLRYGSSPGESLDIFPAARGNAPVLVFIHGGYWRSLDKAEHSFVAPAFTAAGACVVVLNYALCPGTPDQPVTIPSITLQMVKALAWVWRNIARHGGDPGRISVVGHSAGGHLAAMLVACVWPAYAADLPETLVRNALSISGLHELESIRKTPFLQDALRLTPAHALQASPAWLARPAGGRLFTVAGGDESAEFLRQNRLMQSAWGRSLVPVCEELPGLNHFSVLEALVEPGSRLNSLALDLLATPGGVSH